jgi:hypothetical protein
MEQPVPRRPWWRRLRLSVRFLMVLVLIVGGSLGWFIHRATVQRDAVRAIEAAGGTVSYDFQQSPSFLTPSKPPGPKWLVDRIGIDFFANVTSVSFRTSQRNAVVYAPPQTDAILADIGRLPRLERLDANSVRVTDAGMVHLAGLTRLRSLGIEGTPGLTDAGLAHLSALYQLESLMIQGTMGIEGPGLAHLAGLKRLEFLMLDTKTHNGLDSLSKLTGLKKLFLGVTNVSDAASAQLSRLTWLKELALGGEAGSNSGLAHLKALANLETLQLYGPWFTDEGLASVSEIEHLSHFLVADQTSVTPGGLYKLQKQRPGLDMGINGTGQVPKAHLDLLRRSVGPGAVPPASQ